MSVVTSNEYDHIDVVAGSTTNRHYLKDAVARNDIDGLKSAVIQAGSLVTADVECIKTYDTGLNGLYDSNGELSPDTGFKRFYIPVYPNVNYVLTLDYVRNKYSHLCEFNVNGELANVIGVVEASNTFTTGSTTYFIGFAVRTNGFVSASLIQKNLIQQFEKKQAAITTNKISIAPYVKGAITASGNQANYGDAYIISTLSYLVEPRTTIKVAPESGYSCYLAWFTPDGTFIERSANISAETIVTVQEPRIFRFGIFQEGATLDVTATDLYANVYRFDQYNDDFGLCGSGLPSIYLNGDFITMSKDVSKWCDVVGFNFGTALNTFKAKAKVKWQGSSSVQFTKKNFSVTLYEDDQSTKKPLTIRTQWGAISKYVLKANYVDHTMAKNVVCAKLYSSTVLSRDTSAIKTALTATPNNGCVDGFPIKLYINNNYAGIYTFNLAKDEYLFGDGIKIFINAENATDSCRFAADAVFNSENWEVEYTDTDDTTAYQTSFNQISVICRDTTTYPNGDAFRNAISAVLDIPSMIDKMIMIKLCGMSDQFSKNQMFGTYDGTKWFTTMYDMDTAFGFASTGKYVGASASEFNFTAGSNLLMNRIMANYQAEIYARYNALRQSALSNRTLVNTFRGLVADIPHTLMDMDEVLYNIPATQNDTVDQICEYLLMSAGELDAVAGN